jgi:hypothetical protein
MFEYPRKLKFIDAGLAASRKQPRRTASKKYESLICINHHGYIIATGKDMPERLRRLEMAINK